MAKYNKLTKKLLAEGYTAENFPRDKVHIAGGCYSTGNPLENIYGGFEYNRIYCEALIYKTGCGIFVKGSNVISSMGCMGEEWCHENDNPVIRCPYDKAECPKNDERLHGTHGGGLAIQCWCVCHKTDEEYNYESSIEKADQERYEEIERKYQEYSDAHNGRICRNHMYYDERKKEWHLSYDPKKCAQLRCMGMCPLLGKELDKKKGNVYYDIKTTYRRYDLDGTLFEGQIDTSITKGKRKFDHPVSMDICRNYVKLCKDSLIRDLEINQYHYELFMAKYHGREFSLEVQNIRAEQKESRDLMQDLQDIRNGINIFHASDDEKRIKADKSEKRKKAKEKRIKAMEKKILEVGYGNMESFEQNKACRLLNWDRIDELEAIREEKSKNKQEEYVQLNLFDLLLGESFETETSN